MEPCKRFTPTFHTGKDILDINAISALWTKNIIFDLASTKHSSELKNGCRVVMAARRGEVLDQLKEELIIAGGENRAKV